MERIWFYKKLSHCLHFYHFTEAQGKFHLEWCKWDEWHLETPDLEKDDRGKAGLVISSLIKHVLSVPASTFLHALRSEKKVRWQSSSKILQSSLEVSTGS